MNWGIDTKVQTHDIEGWELVYSWLSPRYELCYKPFSSETAYWCFNVQEGLYFFSYTAYAASLIKMSKLHFLKQVKT